MTFVAVSWPKDAPHLPYLAYLQLLEDLTRISHRDGIEWVKVAQISWWGYANRSTVVLHPVRKQTYLPRPKPHQSIGLLDSLYILVRNAVLGPIPIPSPLPLGEGQGVRALKGHPSGKSGVFWTNSPHPNPNTVQLVVSVALVTSYEILFG